MSCVKHAGKLHFARSNPNKVSCHFCSHQWHQYMSRNVRKHILIDAVSKINTSTNGKVSVDKNVDLAIDSGFTYDRRSMVLTLGALFIKTQWSRCVSKSNRYWRGELENGRAGLELSACLQQSKLGRVWVRRMAGSSKRLYRHGWNDNSRPQQISARTWCRRRAHTHPTPARDDPTKQCKHQ